MNDDNELNREKDSRGAFPPPILEGLNMCVYAVTGLILRQQRNFSSLWISRHTFSSLGILWGIRHQFIHQDFRSPSNEMG